eukprot:CAMPEP_0119332522 /NCGR_PEP_ID=MMETSP1333-20130426/82976_1 /TAXON_ID=418940 /ORGANISM="Scyphosphaera apsteinii, Strain RCC1455" /LENGTH=139 /DNA_ID=CAMNT_0007342377 /DNA_START=128 /DNA_END=547 /DNA_ORIENTATION=+
MITCGKQVVTMVCTVLRRRRQSPMLLPTIEKLHVIHFSGISTPISESVREYFMPTLLCGIGNLPVKLVNQHENISSKPIAFLQGLQTALRFAAELESNVASMSSLAYKPSSPPVWMKRTRPSTGRASKSRTMPRAAFPV